MLYFILDDLQNFRFELVVMFGLVRLYGLVYHKLGYALYHFKFDIDFKKRLYRLTVVSGKNAFIPFQQ